MTVRGANYQRRKEDDYPTPEYVTRDILRFLDGGLTKLLCDPAPGPSRSILKAARKEGYDIVDNGRGDFLSKPFLRKRCDILTNPPYGSQGKLAIAFIQRALEVTKPWHGDVVMLLPFDFDAAKTRFHLFNNDRFVGKIVLPYRIKWFDGKSGSINHAWFHWSHKSRHGPTIRYMNPPICLED